MPDVASRILKEEQLQASIKNAIKGKQDCDDAVYQVKVKLYGSKPAIMRHLLIPNTLSLTKLHNILQVAMGWDNYHLHQFEVRFSSRHFIQFNPPEMMEEGPLSLMEDGPLSLMEDDVTYRADKTLLKQVLYEPKQKLYYIYDLGDNWEHEITLMKVLQPGPEGLPKHAICTKASGTCPPEDTGGIDYYQFIMEAFQDKKHPQHKMARKVVDDWFDGDDFDSEEYDIKAVNKQLQKIKY